MAKHSKKIIDVWSAIIIFSLAMIDAILWRGILDHATLQSPRLYFFNVTQGESALVVLPHNIKIMIDAGGDDKIVSQLDSAMASTGDHYIDLAIISYPQLDNYSGYSYLLDHYNVGAFLYNGRSDVSYTKDWSALSQKIYDKNIPLITVGAGDSIHYDGNEIDLLSPDVDLARSADITDTALVEKIRTSAFTALLASDIGENVEDFLERANSSLRADIVKVPFPISGTPEGQDFIHNINPKIIVVSPGVKTLESFPTKSSTASLASSTNAPILRTDQNGMIIIFSNAGKLRVSKEK